MHTNNNDNDKHTDTTHDHLPEPPAWLKLLMALGVAALAYRLLGEREGMACLIAGSGHTLTPLLETLWHAGVRRVQQRRPQNPLTPTQVRALMLCGVVLAVGIGVPAGHRLAPPALHTSKVPAE